jgi:hypothetical protein
VDVARCNPRWDDDVVWAEYCHEVIKPLHENCKRWIRRI